MPLKVSILLILIFLGSCNNQSTPAKERLESAADIKLPAVYQVLKDEFQDMWQDYAVYYDLKFDVLPARQLTENIKQSRYFHKDGSSDMYSDSLNYRESHDFAIWYPAPDGYEFKGKNGAVLYTISVDTTSGILKYFEFVY